MDMILSIKVFVVVLVAKGGCERSFVSDGLTPCNFISGFILISSPICEGSNGVLVNHALAKDGLFTNGGFV